MAINCKAKGTRAEHASMAYLTAAGYTAFRSAGSRGAYDVIAFSATEVVLCQVKAGLRWPGPGERQRLAAFKAPPNCKKVMHRWLHGAKVPDVREIPD